MSGRARSGPPADRLIVRPGGPLAGAFEPPGDKSVTHRAILFGLIAGGTTRIERPNPGADAESSLACAASLGAKVTSTAQGVTIEGTGFALRAPAATLDCGNSGTTLRLLAGVVAGQAFRSTLDGDDSLRRRPVERVVTPLRRMGATLIARDHDRLPPLEIQGGRLRAIDWDLPVASAQVATCVLLAGLRAEGTTRVRLPGFARDHTERMLPAFGVAIARHPGTQGRTELAVTGPTTPTGTSLRVPGDVSAAAFALAAAAARPGARVTARGVGLNPTRTAFLEVLAAMGAEVAISPRAEAAGEPVGDVTVTGPARLRAFDVPEDWVPRMIDEAPAWTIVAAAAEGTSRLRGAVELRVKESDRIATLAAGLARLGLAVDEQPDGLAITGGAVSGGRVRAAHDHRIAMAFAAIATAAREAVHVDEAGGIATSYPGFVDDLRGLGADVGTESGGTP